MLFRPSRRRCCASAASLPSPTTLRSPRTRRRLFSSVCRITPRVVSALHPIPCPSRLMTIVAVSIGWNTFKQLSKPCVKYGKSETSLDHQACSNSSITYHTSRTWSNFVTLTGLEPGCRYYCKSLFDIRGDCTSRLTPWL